VFIDSVENYFKIPSLTFFYLRFRSPNHDQKDGVEGRIFCVSSLINFAPEPFAAIGYNCEFAMWVRVGRSVNEVKERVLRPKTNY
jgi:hypothetical protein